MKTIITVLSFAGLMFASPLFAADAKANQDSLIAQCTKDAKLAGIQEQEMEAFVNNCLDEKIGYEKEEKEEKGK